MYSSYNSKFEKKGENVNGDVYQKVKIEKFVFLFLLFLFFILSLCLLTLLTNSGASIREF